MSPGMFLLSLPFSVPKVKASRHTQVLISKLPPHAKLLSQEFYPRTTPQCWPGPLQMVSLYLWFELGSQGSAAVLRSSSPFSLSPSTLTRYQEASEDQRVDAWSLCALVPGVPPSWIFSACTFFMCCPSLQISVMWPGLPIVCTCPFFAHMSQRRVTAPGHTVYT